MRAPGLLLAALTTLGSCKPAPPGDNSTTTSATTTTTTNSGASTTSGPDPTSLTPTSTTTDANSTSSTGTPDDSAFIIKPDGAPPLNECNGFLQLEPDCPPGQKCTIDGSVNATHCVDIVADPHGLNEPCTVMGDAESGRDDCDLGLICWDVDEQGHGTCIGLCNGEFGDCICADPFALPAFCQECAVGICVADCDPLLQDCAGTDLCVSNLDGTGFTCVLDASGDMGQANDPTEFVGRFSRILDASARWRSSNPVRPAARGTKTYRGYQTSPAVVNPISIGYRVRKRRPPLGSAPLPGAPPGGAFARPARLASASPDARRTCLRAVEADGARWREVDRATRHRAAPFRPPWALPCHDKIAVFGGIGPCLRDVRWVSLKEGPGGPSERSRRPPGPPVFQRRRGPDVS